MERKKTNQTNKIVLMQDSGHLLAEQESAEAMRWEDCPVLSTLFFALYFCLQPKTINVSEQQ